jgi:seryl-tRNA synthetase
MKHLGEKMEPAHWIGLAIAVILLWVTLTPIFLKKEVVEAEKPALKPVAPVMAESQDAINARVKLAAEVGSAISRIEELERSENKDAEYLEAKVEATFSTLQSEIKKLRDDLASISSRVSYQSGAVDTMKAQLKSLEDKPAPTIPKRFRLDVVNYKGQMKRKDAQAIIPPKDDSGK